MLLLLLGQHHHHRLLRMATQTQRATSKCRPKLLPVVVAVQVQVQVLAMRVQFGRGRQGACRA